MAAENAEGIILRKYLLRETSYILVIYTKEFGKIQGVVKGVRGPGPQVSAGNFEIFTRCQLLFYRKKKKALNLITQCETLEYFLNARKDIERLTYASYFIELVSMVTQEDDPNEKIYTALLESLRLLSEGDSPRRVSRIFEIKILEGAGLSPHFEECSSCGASAGEDNYFSASGGGLLCGKCKGQDKHAFRISRGTVNFIRKIQASDFSKVSRIKVSREVGQEIEKALGIFLRYHVGRPIKSLNFLEKMKRTGAVKVRS
jgi:DNA repair protein RecO (recombination protein O)